MEDRQYSLNPEWSTAIKEAMHSSIANKDFTEVMSSPSERNVDSQSEGSYKGVLSPRTSLLRPSFFSPIPRNTKHPTPTTPRRSRYNHSNSNSDSESSLSSVDSSRKSKTKRSTKSRSPSSRFQTRREWTEAEEEKEKFELLARLKQMENEKGYKSFRDLKPTDSIHDIRYEFFRAQREITKKVSIKFMQKGLVSFTSMIELATKYYNPFNLQLDGYSKSVLLTMKDYDSILEELHYKYSDSVRMGPEVKLVMALASSIFFYHTGHMASTFKFTEESRSEPTSPIQGHMKGPSSNSSAEPLQSMMKSFTPLFPGGLSGMMAASQQGDSGLPIPPMPKITDILSGLNMVQTLMNKN